MKRARNPPPDITERPPAPLGALPPSAGSAAGVHGSHVIVTDNGMQVMAAHPAISWANILTSKERVLALPRGTHVTVLRFATGSYCSEPCAAAEALLHTGWLVEATNAPVQDRG